jgi:hypothetical protein
VSDDSSVQINASEARKFPGRGKNPSQSKPTRFCTFCNRTNHIVDFFYLKHGFPNKTQPRVNVTTNEDVDAGNSSSIGSGSSTGSSTGFTQEQLVQLASLLQQANLVVPASPPPQATSNHIAATPLISITSLHLSLPHQV